MSEDVPNTIPWYSAERTASFFNGPVEPCPTCPEGWRPLDKEHCASCYEGQIERLRADRDSWEAQFHSAANATAEYSEFYFQYSGCFDMAGNYIPHSQIDGDLRAAKAKLDKARDVLSWLDERGKNSTSYGSHADAYEVAARKLREAIA